MKKLFLILACVAFVSACSEDSTEEAKGSQSQIEIGVQSLEFLASGEAVADSNPVTVTSSSDWRLTGLKTWCSPSAVAGKSGDKVTFVAEANTGELPRSITYTFFCGEKATKLVVTQQGDRVIDVEDDQLKIAATGDDQLKIRLLSSSELTAEVGTKDQTWITPFDTSTRSLELSYLYYKIAANDTYAARTGHIMLTGADGAKRTITVNQDQNNAIKSEKEIYQEQLTASEVRVVVWSNVPYAVQIPADVQSWITLDAQPGPVTVWASQELVFYLAAAASYRIGTISLVAADNSITIPVGFQQGEPIVFQVPDQNFKDYLLTEKGYITAVGSGYMTTVVGAAATAIDTYTTLWSKKGCESLAGIENFTNLTTLNCQYNRLDALDISATKVADLTKCAPNPLESLSVGPNATTVAFSGKLYDYNTKISGGYPTKYSRWATNLVVKGSELTSIDVSNNHLQTLDVSACPKLTNLKCIQESGYTLTTLTLAESQRGKVTISAATGTTIVYK